VSADDEVGAVTRADRLTAGAALLPRAGRVLDVGCGDGSLTLLVRGGRCFVAGVDRDAARLRDARRKGVAVACADLDVTALPYSDGAFGAVACLDVVEHVLDPGRLLGEIARVLRPGGVLVLTTPNIRFYPFVLSLLRGRFPRTGGAAGDDGAWDGGHWHYFTFADIRQLVGRAGFERVEEFGLYRFTALTRRGRIKEALKALLGDHLKREFFSGAVVVRATRAAAR